MREGKAPGYNWHRQMNRLERTTHRSPPSLLPSTLLKCCLYSRLRFVFIPPATFNRHHSLYPRRNYKTPTERKFRHHPFLINRIEVEAHTDLHAVIQPPLKLTHNQMLGALCFLDELAGEALQAHERLEELGDYLLDRTDRERKVGVNLQRQARFIQVFGIEAITPPMS